MPISQRVLSCLAAGGLSVAALTIGSFASAQQSMDGDGYGEWGVDLTAMDRSVDPGDDFYRYVSGKWLARSTIPDGYPNWTAFTKVGRKTDQQVDAMIADLLASPQETGTSEQQLADFYRSYVDVERRNRVGIEPLRDLIDGFMMIDDRADLMKKMGLAEATRPVNFGVVADPGNPEKPMLVAVQGGLTMPDPIYYLGEGEQFDAARAAFLDYAETLFRQAGFADARERADMMLELEKEIARRSWSAQQRRDQVKMYHPMTIAELQSYAPGIDWPVLLDAAGAGAATEINVNTDTAVRDLAALVAQTPIETWRTYLVFHLLNDYAPLLSTPLADASFAFTETALSGVETQRPLKEQAIGMLGELLGEPIGKLYAERYFPPEYEETIDTMIGYLRDEYRDRFVNNDWMDDRTRAEALAKLDQVTSYIGSPERYHDLTSIRIAPDDLVGNVRRISEWHRADNMSTLGHPTRDWEWPFAVQEINAGYVPARNSVTFPAGILQPPFFHPDGDIAVNFGSIGAVIGHELGHAFDDQGKSYDGTGKIRNWWTPQSEAAFRKRADRLVAQFNEYAPIEGEHVNGALTLGENIGDLGGLTVGYAAYRRYVNDKQGGKASVIDGFTGDQRYFLGWGQLWRMLSTDAETRRRLAADVHSPGEFRANGAVRNVDGWYEAFDVEPGDALYLPPEQRVHIW
ncbi:M13 family metallopeptidase [Qipengyuania sp. GH25]|uniref:M13 family metallopeptidase n=1 Tax=Qipengyuania pacifica TaxID=2860199 RepID=A0ABS7JAD4_9SPHN|nr:M13 family metallopeptidase [Qipengyuania aerophila]MBX7486970.1 M13 family metallopeptidase [Qipengyuania aerophila]